MTGSVVRQRNVAMATSGNAYGLTTSHATRCVLDAGNQGETCITSSHGSKADRIIHRTWLLCVCRAIAVSRGSKRISWRHDDAHDGNQRKA